MLLVDFVICYLLHTIYWRGNMLDIGIRLEVCVKGETSIDDNSFTQHVKLLTGGDDQRVLVWRLWESVSRNTKPRCMKQSHQSNIFCVAFDLDNRHIISAGKLHGINWQKACLHL